MTLFDPTTTTAAVTACVSVALSAGHWIGDHPMQPDTAAAGKGQPTDDRLTAGAHPWTGWSHLTRHLSTYLLAQAVALALIAPVAPLTLPGAVAALAVSGSTHAVIDRRWIVRAIIRAKGCHGWADAPYLIDQALHHGAMFLAAITAALVTTTAGAAVVLVLGGALIAAGLTAEHLRGTALAAGPTATDRL